MTIQYLQQTSTTFTNQTLKLNEKLWLTKQWYFLDRGEKIVGNVQAYLKAVGMFRNYNDAAEGPVFSEVEKKIQAKKQQNCSSFHSLFIAYLSSFFRSWSWI